MTYRGTRIRNRRPPVTAGLDFTGPVADLIDTVTERLSDRWAEDHPGAYMSAETYDKLAETADEMVIRRLK